MSAHVLTPYAADDPSRPVDWRDESARRLVESERFANGRRYDPATRTIAGYLRHFRNSDAIQNNPSSGFVDLHRAYELRRRSPLRLLALIEASLLTGEKLEESARRFGITVACLRWYAAAFFDVRDRLQLRHFVLHQGRDQVERIWKLVGYLGGRTTLSELVGSEKVEGLQQLEVLLQQQTEFNYHVSVHALAENSVDPKALSALRKIISTAETLGDASQLNDYEKQLRVMMENIPWRAGRAGDPNSPVTPYEGSAAELRADEMLNLWLGVEPPDAAELLAKKLPVPRASESGT